MDNKNEYLHIEESRESNKIVPMHSKQSYNNGDGGGSGNMDNRDKYVTHPELDASNEKILHHMDQQFNDIKIQLTEVKDQGKFTDQKVNWILTILGAVIATVIATLIFK